VPQVNRRAAQPQRELGELICLELSIAGAHLGRDLADPALDSKLLGLERVSTCVPVGERPLELRARLLVASWGSVDQGSQLLAERAEVDAHRGGHQTIISRLSSGFMGRPDYFRHA